MRVSDHESRAPRTLALFTEWLGISEGEFHATVEKFRNLKVWEKAEDGAWRHVDPVTNHRDDPGVAAARLEAKGPCDFRVTPHREDVSGMVDDRYILLGRGYVDS